MTDDEERPDRVVQFTALKDITAQDWAIVGPRMASLQRTVADRVIAHLKLLAGDAGGFPIDRFEHSVQTATRAYRDGRDEEYVVCALLHDFGDTLGSANHAEVAATILKPYIGAQNEWMVEKHAIFQGYYFFDHLGLDRDLRDQFRGHPWFEYTAQFCHLYDQAAFDPAYDSMPFDAFEPMIQRVFSTVKRPVHVRSEQPIFA
jgi:predicted HD phosphohydrolase